MSYFYDPSCDEVTCFAHNNGRCSILDSRKFKGGKCPFFKTLEQLQKERLYCAERLFKMTQKTEE